MAVAVAVADADAVGTDGAGAGSVHRALDVVHVDEAAALAPAAGSATTADAVTDAVVAAAAAGHSRRRGIRNRHRQWSATTVSLTGHLLRGLGVGTMDTTVSGGRASDRRMLPLRRVR